MHARGATGSAAPGCLPVVLVHGFGTSSSYFVPTAERLAAQFDVYAPDLPGHGKSDAPQEALDVPQLADSLIGWMDAAGLRRVSLVGHSMGCQIAADAAVRYPERVDRLVLVGPTSDPTCRTTSEVLWRSVPTGQHERLSLNLLLLVDYARMGRRLIPEFRWMLRDRIENKLRRVDAPTMIVRGERDYVVPQRWVEQAARLARAERVVVIRKWGHAVNYSAAGALTEAIAPFLRAASETAVDAGVRDSSEEVPE